MATPIRFDRGPFHRTVPTLAFSFVLLLAAAPGGTAGVLSSAGAPGSALPPRGGQVQIPESSTEDPRDVGFRAHTNLRMLVPAGGMDDVAPPAHAALTKGV